MDVGLKLNQSMGFTGDLFKGWPCQFRINKYNFKPETIGLPGVHNHTDAGFLTILQDDENVGGLEVMDDKSGKFIAVHPWPSTLIVNLGDIAKVGNFRCHLGLSRLIRKMCLYFRNKYD